MKKSNLKSRLTTLAAALLTCGLTAMAQETAFTQDFTGESENPADYGFTVTGTEADGMSATVTNGKLALVAGNNGGGSRGYDAKAAFTAIGEGNEVTMTCTWATGNATGNNSNASILLTDGTNNAVKIAYYGQSKYLEVNGEQVATGVNRDGTYDVTVTLNTTTQTITALQVGNIYTLSNPIPFISSDCKAISTFQFSHWARANWANTSTVDNIVVSYKTAEVDPDYVEPIASVAIEGADKMTFGPDPDTAADNVYTVKIMGTNGTVIDENTLSPKVSDFKVVWNIEGFQTENDTEGQYCDSYGTFSVNGEGKAATTFLLRNVPMNFYGRMTATITYNGTTTTATKYVVALGDLTHKDTQVLPLPGYPALFSAYPAALDGYNVTKETYGNGSDLILGGWCVAGSDNHIAQLQHGTDGTGFVRLTANNLKKSHVLTNTITSPTQQTIFSTMLRFNTAGAVVTLTGGYPFWSSSRYTCPVSLNFDGTNITLNGTKLKNGDADAQFNTAQWYQVYISADKTTENCYAIIADREDNIVGETDILPWAETSSPVYFSIGMGNSNTGSVDMAACEVYVPQAALFTLTADKETLSIPQKEEAQLVATVTDENGMQLTGLATWSVVEQDMQESVTITPDASDSHKATVKVTDGAVAGTVTIQVTIGGSTKTVALTLTSSEESIKFTESTTSITIPLDETETSMAAFTAVIVDGQGNELESDVAIALYQKDGVTPFTGAEGIYFDTQYNTLTVSSTAMPTTLVVRATGKNSKGEELSKSITVNIHGYTFDFGFGTDDAIAEGYTVVTAATAYNDLAGYGIVTGTATEGGSASTTNADDDYLSGAFGFNLKVMQGEFYTVKITYQGQLTTGYVNSDLAGFELGTQTSLATAEYTIAATTSIIDLRVATTADVSEARIASITITKQAPRQQRAKRRVMHIGDSTSANNGSWAYRLSKMADTYPELFELCDFQNRGAGGRNLSTYYTQGKLNSVLLDICPGDIVMIGNNGTNGMGQSFEDDMNYYIDAAEALGAQVIINSYTPHGAVGNYTSGYDATTHTFNSYRKDAYETIVRKIAEERAANDENYLGFVEIGKNADAIFNAYVADYAANGYATADAAAQAIIGCFADHNHYNQGTLACDLMLNGYATCEAKGIVDQLRILLGDTATGISQLHNGQQDACGVYNLHGVRVADSTNSLLPGLYIVNGRKVVVK